KGYNAEAETLRLEGAIDDARERVYGRTYAEWNQNHQPAATPEQLAACEARQKK
ncbi:DUF1244 domain-containing protein, partial [Vibrio parahaemolyticus]|nr:DUF1244 domain-containing protein [Vibrio parahaemolyticus]